MLKLALLCVLVVGTYETLVWKDCSKDVSTQALTIHEFDISPNPIVFPGNLSVTLNLTINRAIDHLFIDTKLAKKSGLFQTLLDVPCIGNTNIGSCSNIDACSILDDILNGSTVVSVELGQQIDTILLAALDHHATCPIKPETVHINNQVVTLQPLPGLISQIGNGDYVVQIKIKDDSTSTEDVGCLSFETGIRRMDTGGLSVGKK